jgi:hypothetical protein
MFILKLTAGYLQEIHSVIQPRIFHFLVFISKNLPVTLPKMFPHFKEKTVIEVVLKQIDENI